MRRSAGTTDFDTRNQMRQPPFSLTDPDILSILLSSSMQRKGTIRAKGKCPTCHKAFTEIKGLGFICKKHKTVPRKFYIDLYWKGQRIRIFLDRTGQPLDTYDRADTLLKSIHTEIETRTFDPTKYIKVEAAKYYACNLLDTFLDEKLQQVAPSYRRAYRRMVRIARAYFDKRDVRELRKIDIKEYIDYCKKTQVWSEKSLKNNIDLFKTFMNYLKDDLEIISTVPAFPIIDVPEKTFKWVSSEDQMRLFEMVPAVHRPIIGFLMLHGVRPAEARALKCRDINLEAGFITVAATFSEGEYRPRRKGKGAKPLYMPIHPEMIDFLRERVEGNHPEAFVFVNVTTGDPYSAPMIGKIWRMVRAEAGIGPYELRLYDASRHSLASQLVNSGTSLFAVSKLLGHSSTKMSEKYAHADLSQLKVELSKVSLTNRSTVTRLSPREKSDEKDQ